MPLPGVNVKRSHLGFFCGTALGIVVCALAIIGTVYLTMNTWNVALKEVEAENANLLDDVAEIFKEHVERARALTVMMHHAGNAEICAAVATSGNSTINVTKGLLKAVGLWEEVLLAEFVPAIEMQFITDDGSEAIEIEREDNFHGEEFDSHFNDVLDSNTTKSIAYLAFKRGEMDLPDEEVWASPMIIFRHNGCVVVPHIPAIHFAHMQDCSGFVMLALSFEHALETVDHMAREFAGDSRGAESLTVMIVDRRDNYFYNSRNASKEFQVDFGTRNTFVDDWGQGLADAIEEAIVAEEISEAEGVHLDDIMIPFASDENRFLMHIVDVSANEYLVFVACWDNRLITSIAGVSILFYVMVCYAFLIVTIFALLVGHVFKIGAKSGMEQYIKLIFQVRHIASAILSLATPILIWVVRNPSVQNELQDVWVPVFITAFCAATFVYHVIFLVAFWRVMRTTLKLLRRLAPFQSANSAYLIVIIVVNLGISWKVRWSLSGFVIVESLLYAAMQLSFFVVHSAGNRTTSNPFTWTDTKTKGSKGGTTGMSLSSRELSGTSVPSVSSGDEMEEEKK